MSAIRTRVREIETLVDHREVCDDIALHSLDERGPVIDRGVLDLTALQSIVWTRAHPMDDFAAPSFDCAECATIRGYRLSGGRMWAAWQFVRGSGHHHNQF